MDTILTSTETKIKIESGEEALYKVYRPKVAIGTKKKIVGGVDVGSTQSRASFIFNRRVNLDSVKKYVIPSNMALISGSSGVEYLSDKLYDTMHSKVGSTAVTRGGDGVCGSVVRGSLLEESAERGHKLRTAMKKSDSPSLLFNMIDSIGYGLIMDAEAKGIDLAESYEIGLCFSLPPSELLALDKDKFILDITNSFIWEHPSSNITLTIKIVDAILASEVESSAEAFARIYFEEEEREEIEFMCSVEGGGRSSGNGILKNGRVRKSTIEDYDSCGSMLVDALRTYVNTQHGNHIKVDKVLTDALDTGVVKLGKTSIPLENQIKLIKGKLGDAMFDDILNTFDGSSSLCSIDMIEIFFFSGRLFKRGALGYSVLDSILENLRKLNKSFFAFASFDGYLVPTGNALMAYDKFSDMLSDTEETLEISPEDIEDILQIVQVENYFDKDGNLHSLVDFDDEDGQDSSEVAVTTENNGIEL